MKTEVKTNVAFFNRRRFIQLSVSTAAAQLISPVSVGGAISTFGIKAVAFDALAVFDPGRIVARAEKLFPGRGVELCNVWRTRQFEYSWLRGLAGRYADFWQVTGEALMFAAKMTKLDLTAEHRAQLMAAHLELEPWPDAPLALAALGRAGVRMALLSNFTPAMLRASVEHSGLQGVFDHLLSTDAAKTYKPDPRAYHLAVDAFQLRREQIAFVAFGGWDAAGARAFGYHTFWANRQSLPAEELDFKADACGSTLEHLPKFITGEQ